jgi:RNA polymerase sigma factor (sigma-70 family)
VQAYAEPQTAHDLARDRAFERLYRRYGRDVYRYSLAVLRNPADAEDITQTTFLNAYRAYLRGEEPVRPRNWLIKIAHNACRTRHLRAVRRPQEVPLEETVVALRVPPEEAPKVEELLAALGRLPFNQRAALVMRELEGRTYAEIAETLDVSVAAVETLIFRARRSLRRDPSLFGALSAVQLPPSLSSLAAGGGGAAAVAGGGAVAGSGLLLKAVLVVAAGLVVGTVGTAVQSTRGARSPDPPAALLQSGGPIVMRSAVPGAAGAPMRMKVRVSREGRQVTRESISGTRASRARDPVVTSEARSSLQEAAATAGAADTGAGSAAGDTTASTPTSASPVSSVSSSSVTTPVTEVTSQVTSEVPSQPEVQAPPLPPVPPPPPLPVATPSVPEPPAVPSTPSTPSLPPTPTVPSLP